MSNLVGYARVSRHDQEPAAQEAELRAAGAGRVFVDHGESSRIRDRPDWLACLDYLRPGDTLVVRRLDRIAGSEKMAIERISDLHERGLAHARAQGGVGGRPSVMTPERTAEAVRMRDQGESIAHVARVLGVGKSSVARALARVDRLQLGRLVDVRMYGRDMETVSRRDPVSRTSDLRLAWFLVACTGVTLLGAVNPATLSFVVVAVLNLVRVYRRSDESRPRRGPSSGLHPHVIR